MTCRSKAWRQSSSDTQLCTLAFFQLNLLKDPGKMHPAKYNFVRVSYASLALPPMTRGDAR